MSYADELRIQSDRVVEDHPGLRVEWRDSELVFPKAALGGFEVRLLPVSDGVVVLTDLGLHVHLEDTPSDAVRDALGLARDLLSADMRIVEHRAGPRAYRWSLERRAGGRWVGEAQTGLLFWNYFARRSERIYQNRQLPGRLAEDASEDAR